MIKLLVPALIGGRLVPAGTVTAAPEALEKKLISAGNAGKVPAENPTLGTNVDMTAAEVLDLAKRAQKLKLDLPDNLTNDQVREAIEKAEKDLAGKTDSPTGSAKTDEAPETGQVADGEAPAAAETDDLKLGRAGVQAK